MSKKLTYQNNQMKHKLKILLLIIITNILTIYICTHFYSNPQNPISTFSKNSLPQLDSTTLIAKLNATEDDLAVSHYQIANLQKKLKSTSSLVEKLLAQISLFNLANVQSSEPEKPEFNDHFSDISDEAKLGIGPHKLPLGFLPRMGSDELYASVGGACLKYKEDLNKYMSYNIGGECPVDDIFAQALMLKGCEPLPRRRCHPKSPTNYVDPTSLPESLWSTPADSSIIWDPYTCKNYKCLVERVNGPGSYDCKDCFHLQGLDFGIDEVLGVKPQGTIRIGVDIGGGSGTFAARMKERNVTIITTSMNFDAPFNSFISSRGLLSMHVSISQRLPFFENTLDIVHSMHVLSNWIPDAMLEFTLYDIYRVLRPGGLFWLDRFFCLGEQLNATYVPIFDRVGFNKLRWYSGMKLDRGIEKNEWYFSALLEKPMT
ncbi:hypothetical protein ACJIZ3_001019 [Penstemon smallii]|uniref:Methyltransferase type 11 domain-containing protein n=1 Tax=Penstemon smallii TaxID=265156 RepID=A0ABD3U459_9LAMI